MLVKKNFNFLSILKFTGHHLIWLLPLIFGVGVIQEYSGWDWTKLPFQPISLVGTAVAFYLGFKNNQSYDRLWEARKVWGGIVNSSRAWGSSIGAYVSNLHATDTQDGGSIKTIQKRMLYRHIGWLYALRSQLLIPTEWEHIKQRGLVGYYAKLRQKKYGVGLFESDVTEKALLEFLPKTEHDTLLNYKNTATHIINQQAKELKELREAGLIDDFRHMELQKLLNEFYIEQGKLERIKKFPLPRQYGGISFILVGIFIAILPFGMLPLFQGMGPAGLILSIPLTALVAWVYLVMELVGDYSENPFEGTANDIPMLSLCRTIEIDLREMLGETDLPPVIEATKGVLM